MEGIAKQTKQTKRKAWTITFGNRSENGSMGMQHASDIGDVDGLTKKEFLGNR